MENVNDFQADILNCDFRMDQAKIKRTSIRTSFTKTANKLEELLKSSILSSEDIEILLEQLSEKAIQLKSIDDAICKFLEEKKCTQKEYDEEYNSCELYQEKFILLKTKCKFLRTANVNQNGTSSGCITSTKDNDELRFVNNNSAAKYSLPVLELPKFNGNPRDWLGFWTQFEKIHEDGRIDARDKFAYLIQSTIPNSKPRQILDSFPPTAENYPKAVSYLKERFGKENILIQVYVRDLLHLVINDKKPGLSTLYDELQTKLRGLESLGLTKDKYAEILFPLVESCMPAELLMTWERNLCAAQDKNEGKSDLDSLIDFLRIEVESDQKIKLARNSFSIEKVNKKNYRKVEFDSSVPTAAELFISHKNVRDENTLSTNKSEFCIFCKNRFHSSGNCEQVSNMSLFDKKEAVKKQNACFVCLKRGHRANQCKSKIKCLICQNRHLVILCPDLPTKANKSDNSGNNEKKTSTLNNQINFLDVLLQTLIVRLRNGSREQLVRGIIDTGSMKSYICENVAEEMHYDVLRRVNLKQNLFGGIETEESVHNEYNVELLSFDKSFNCKVELLSQPNICSDIKQIPSGPWVKELRNHCIKLSDFEKNSINVDKTIKLLIGADIAGKLLTGKIINLKSGPVAVETSLGWTLMGKIPVSSPNETYASICISSLLVNNCISDLWKLDILNITDPAQDKSKRELEADTINYFNETINIDPDGRYEVALPWVTDRSILPDNFNLAEKCFTKIKSKLTSSNNINAYNDVFKNWLSLNIIEISNPEATKGGHYLPHRPIFKEESTTKIRPVFNASARTGNSPSLNDCLATGPNLIEIIPSILNKFRKNAVGVTSDIEKAFLQISVRDKDRDFLRFLWVHKDNFEQSQIYRHRRVVFGIRTSPFLLAATLGHHLNKVTENLKQTAEILKDSFYVDNCVASLRSIEEVEKFILESKFILASGHFNLRGWRSNLSNEMIKEDQSLEKCVSVLGLIWNTQRDTLSCNFEKIPSQIDTVTKRRVLAIAQQVFDPIGYTCPVMLIPKLILQETWHLKLKWDDSLPDHLTKKFKTWLQQLPLLSEIKIPRWFKFTNNNELISFHVFCDSSQTAYGTCIYLRVEHENEVTVSLISARSRVAPLKHVTIPRLELLACLIGARLLFSILKDLQFPMFKIYCWTDSTTALCWIRREQSWSTFVHNRVKEIRSLTSPTLWYHIPGTFNLADLASRGCSSEQFIRLRWWEGPSWLYNKEETWPKSEGKIDEDLISSERRKTVLTSLNKSEDDFKWYYNYFSSYNKIVRMLAWIFRFYGKLKKINSENSLDLTVSEFEAAEIALIRLIQKESFTGPKDEKIRNLRPMIDKNDIIRAQTNIMFRDDTEYFKYPVILPSNHTVVHLLIMKVHCELLHAGTSLVMTHIRERYWVLKSRKTIRNCIRRCIKCQRFKAKNYEVTPGILPEDRVRDAKVFEIVGVDLAGPLHLRNKQKAYIVLFTCAVYRAVHLELITQLTTEAFIQSLRRFISRRGRPTKVYSDNGTNFVGTNNVLGNIDWKIVQSKAVEQRIQWKFNPPSAAWWGGWWERLVQMVKQILRKVLGRASLNYEEMLTILCDCEQVINTRPLTYTSQDIEDVTPLTPAMFLHEISSSGVPDLDIVDGEKLSKRAKHLQKIREVLRRRFRSEYLGQLRQISAKSGITAPISVGEVVLLEETNKKRATWSLGRVLKVYPGRDGHTRLVLVKTENTEFLRPIQRLYKLELDNSPDDSNLSNFKNSPRTTRSGRLIKTI